MASPEEKVVTVLAQDTSLRNKLNYALDDIFNAAQLSKLTVKQKQNILEKLKGLIVVDEDYTNIHVHWT